MRYQSCSITKDDLLSKKDCAEFAGFVLRNLKVRGIKWIEESGAYPKIGFSFINRFCHANINAINVVAEKVDKFQHSFNARNIFLRVICEGEIKYLLGRWSANVEIYFF